MDELINLISNITDRLPEVPEVPSFNSTQPEVKAIQSRNLIMNAVEPRISWDPQAVTEYFNICTETYEKSYRRLQNLKASISQCRVLGYRIGIQKYNLRRIFTGKEDNNEIDQQRLSLNEGFQKIKTRCMQIAIVQKQWIHVNRLNWILVRTAYLNMAYIKAVEMGDIVWGTGNEELYKELKERLAEARKTKTGLLISLYDALAWARLEQKEVITEVTTFIETLPW